MIAPAPRKPIPVTICAAIRVGSKTIPSRWEKLQSDHAYAETRKKSAEPSETSRCVRSPASRSRSSRSRPIAPPSPAATKSLIATSSHESSGKGVLLCPRDLCDPSRREVEQLVELLAGERQAFGGRLHLDELAVARHHDVHVGLGGRVLGVLEIEERLTVDDPDGDGSDRPRERLREAELVERATGGHVCAGDRRAARPPVGLKHVAVEPDRPLAQRLEVDHPSQRASDQPLDLDRAATLLAARGLPCDPLAGRRGEQRVLGGHPAFALVAQPARDVLVDHRRAEHLRLALRPEYGAVRLLEVVELDGQGPKLVGAAALPHVTVSSSSSSTCSTSRIGSCRNRAPVSRNTSGSPVVMKR